MQGLCHDQSDGQGVQSQMVLSIGSTPLIKMPFRAAPIHIQAVFIEAFHLQAVCRRELCLPSAPSVSSGTQMQQSMEQHVDSSVLSLVKHQTLSDPRGDPRGAQTQPIFCNVTVKLLSPYPGRSDGSLSTAAAAAAARRVCVCLQPVVESITEHRRLQ